jgi:DNA-binding MarR family transcriptional regulator
MIEPTSSTPPLYSVGTYRIADSIGFLLKRVRASLTAAVDRQMAEYDISHDQWGVLIVMAQGHEQSAAELARTIECDGGSMTRMIDRLEAKGYLTRERRGHDRRVVWLQLTPAGKDLAEKLKSVVVDVQNHHLRGFTADELEVFKDFLRRMLANR